MRVVVLVVAVALVAVAGIAQAARQPTGSIVDCAHQSLASFPHAFTSIHNLVVGPLAMIGAGEWPAGTSVATAEAVVKRFGGQKYPALVRAGHRVTVAIRTRGVTMDYGPSGRRKLITFASCSADHPGSQADGKPVTFWSGFVRTSKPRCVQLDIWLDRDTKPRRREIEVGRRCS
jgi:hypothetical protein